MSYKTVLAGLALAAASSAFAQEGGPQEGQQAPAAPAAAAPAAQPASCDVIGKEVSAAAAAKRDSLYPAVILPTTGKVFSSAGNLACEFAIAGNQLMPVATYNLANAGDSSKYRASLTQAQAAETRAVQTAQRQGQQQQTTIWQEATKTANQVGQAIGAGGRVLDQVNRATQSFCRLTNSCK